MKKLSDYVADVTSSQEINMKPMHIMAEQANGTDALWNTTDDRWSRRAKYQLNLAAKLPSDNNWELGDIALYENDYVEISITDGPNSTIGILVNGQTKMVRGSTLTKLDENVVGGMRPLNPLNRMMQLAGLGSPTIIGEDEEIAEDDVEIISEANTDTMFDGLYRTNSTGEFKNNPEAARLATIGQIMIGLESQVNELRENSDQELIKKLDAAIGLGALLIKTAKEMLRPK